MFVAEYPLIRNLPSNIMLIQGCLSDLSLSLYHCHTYASRIIKTYRKSTVGKGYIFIVIKFFTGLTSISHGRTFV